MDSDLCNICGIELGRYQQKHFCQDCKYVLCSGCHILRMKLFYMTNYIIDITPGYCFTCQTLKKYNGTETEDAERLSNVSSNFTKEKTAETSDFDKERPLDQGGTKELKGNNSKTTEYLANKDVSTETKGNNSDNFVNEGGSFSKEHSKGDNTISAGGNTYSSRSYLEESKVNTVYHSGDSQDFSRDSKGKFNSNQSTDFENLSAISKGDNTEYKTTMRAENTDSRRIAGIQVHNEHETGYSSSLVNSKASRNTNSAVRQGLTYVSNSKMKWNQLNDQVNTENKDQEENGNQNETKTQSEVAFNTEAEKQIAEASKTEGKEQKKEDEGEETKGGNSTVTGKRKEKEEQQEENQDTTTASAEATGGKRTEVKENKSLAIPQKKPSKLQRLREGTYKLTCAGCGRKDCEGSYMKLLREMISTAKAAKFEIHNVTPDGNCMFAAVVDQLELQHDRSFSPRGLRQACIEFLRDNPESDDGTPYVLFLDNESWEDYLSRMCREGEWGDHMMLKAIAEVTGRSIQVIHNDRQRDWTRIETQLPGENYMYPITLGHVGEFHYVSLRPSDPIKKSTDKNTEDEDFQSMDSFSSLSIPSLHDARREMFQEDYVDYFSDVPSLHLSYLIKKLFPSSVIKMADQMMETAIAMELQRQEMVQPIFQQEQKMDAYSASKQSVSVLVKAYGEVVEGLWVPYITERERTQFDKGSEWADVKMMHILNQASAYPKDYEDLAKMDVLIESEHVHPGYARLLANYPDTWGLSENPGEKSMTYYVPNKHAYFESLSGDRSEKDSFASQNLLLVSLFCNATNAVACPIWPKEAEEWKSRVRPANWPPSEVIDSVIQDGCHFEGKPHVNSTNPDIEFRFCFGMAERYLATHVLSKEQRLCFLLFKSLCSQEFRGENLISGDHLLSIFFFACEQLPKECWSTKLGSCLFFLLDCLMTSIQERSIPNYFIPANNMLDHLNDSQFEQVGQHIFALRSQPFTHLVTIAHQKGILNATDILFKVQADFPEFREHRNARQSVMGVLVPLTIELAQECIHDNIYKKALELVQEAYEERLSVSTCEDQLPFAAFVSEVINRYPLPKQWWFLFFTDEKLGTTLYADLTLPLSPVTMEEILPEKISKNYKGVLIPLSMAENMCTFCYDFASYLVDKNRTYQAFDVIQHALEKYNEFKSNPSNPNENLNFGDCSDMIVFNLYTKYVYVCQKIDRLALIPEKMAEIETICGRINSASSYTQLACIWKILGDETKSNAATLKVKSLQMRTSVKSS